MVDEEELRARIAARIASRQAAEPGTSGARAADGTERNVGPEASSVVGPSEDHEPLESEQPPPVPRFLEPVRPWLDDNRPGPAPDAPPAPVDPAITGEPGSGGRMLDPIRPWQIRNPAPRAATPSPPPVDAPDGTSAHPLQPVRPWLYQRTTEPSPSEPPPTEPSHAESPAAPTHDAVEPSAHKRRWRRNRDDVDDDESMADWLAPTDADTPDTDVATNNAVEPVPAHEPVPVPIPEPVLTPGPVPAPEPPASTDEVPDEESDEESDEARQGRLRRALDWLLEPADPANPAPDDDETFDDPFAADEHTHVLPRVVEPVAEAPVADPLDEQPATEHSADQPEDAVPDAAEPIELTPGVDLARRLAAAHAAAKDRAGTAPPVEPEGAEDDAPRAEPPPVRSPLVTGAAFAKRAAAADPTADGSGADEDVPDVRKRPGRTLHRLLVTAVVVAFAVAAALLLRAFVVAPYYIPSASMEPTLHGCAGCNNDHVLVNKLSYRVHGIHRGDVVVFHRPKTWQVSDKVLIKRVIGVPGDVLTTRNGIVYVDGLQLEEPYLDPNCKSGTVGLPAKSVTVAPDTAFVMGDNRCDSSDSRRFGAIPESSVIGRAFVTIWPFGRIHWL